MSRRAGWRLQVGMAALLVTTGAAANPVCDAPYALAPGVLDARRSDLGLQAATGTQSVTVFAPGDEASRFNNGAVLMPFKGRLYAQWQSSARDEDSADTRVLYSWSDDGLHWQSPQVLVVAGGDGAMHSNGGWWTDDETLVAYVNVWPDGFQSRAGGWTEAMTSRDGVHWSTPQRVLDGDGAPVDGVIEQDPRTLPDGRIVTAFHLRPGMHVAPFVTDDPLGLRGWRRGEMVSVPSEDARVSRALEPSTFQRRRDGRDCVVMVFRDQASSFRQLASESCDGGSHWTPPTLTGMPDARAKQSAGNLPDGSAFLVNAPNAARERVPLAVTLSRDGHVFDRAFLLRGRGDLPALRYPGRYKRPGYHYPKSVLWREHLYVAYAVNKEDIALTRVPVASLVMPAPRAPDAD